MQLPEPWGRSLWVLVAYEAVWIPKSVWMLWWDIVDKHKLYAGNDIQSSLVGGDITCYGERTPTFQRKLGFCFSHPCCWRFKSSAMQRCVIMWVVTNVLEILVPSKCRELCTQQEGITSKRTESSWMRNMLRSFSGYKQPEDLEKHWKH
jgi:hypothetical protein